MDTGKYYIDCVTEMTSSNGFREWVDSKDDLTEYAQEITIYDYFLGCVTFGGSKWIIDKNVVLMNHRDS
jgi:hypothetical protein